MSWWESPRRTSILHQQCPNKVDSSQTSVTINTTELEQKKSTHTKGAILNADVFGQGVRGRF